MYLIVLSSAILLCNFDAIFCLAEPRRPRASDRCHSFVDGPFDFCSTKVGYNTTFKYPDFLTDSLLAQTAKSYTKWFTTMKNCSSNGLAETLVCHYIIPHCSGGKRIYPCKRVCSEFLKQCEDELYVTHMEFIIRTCHTLPDSACFEPPNFSTNDSVKGKYKRHLNYLTKLSLFIFPLQTVTG